MNKKDITLEFLHEITDGFDSVIAVYSDVVLDVPNGYGVLVGRCVHWFSEELANILKEEPWSDEIGIFSECKEYQPEQLDEAFHSLVFSPGLQLIRQAHAMRKASGQYERLGGPSKWRPQDMPKKREKIRASTAIKAMKNPSIPKAFKELAANLYPPLATASGFTFDSEVDVLPVEVTDLKSMESSGGGGLGDQISEAYEASYELTEEEISVDAFLNCDESEESGEADYELELIDDVTIGEIAGGEDDESKNESEVEEAETEEAEEVEEAEEAEVEAEETESEAEETEEKSEQD